MGSNKVDRGARAEDVEISEQIADVEGQHLGVEARAKQPTHNTFNPFSSQTVDTRTSQRASRRCTILSRSWTTKAYHETQDHLYFTYSTSFSHRLCVSAKVQHFFLLCLISTCIVLYCNECVGFGYSHFQNGFGLFLVCITNLIDLQNICSFCGSCFAWNRGFVVHGA